MNKICIKLIKIYQNSKNENSQKHCKYSPTCSNYALGVFEKFNFFKALFLTIYRIIRCNPFSKGGYDPVPLTKKEKLENLLKERSNSAPQITEKPNNTL